MKKEPIKKNFIIIPIVLLATILLVTIGYAAFSAELGITGMVATISPTKEVRVNGVSSTYDMSSLVVTSLSITKG